MGMDRRQWLKGVVQSAVGSSVLIAAANPG